MQKRRRQKGESMTREEALTEIKERVHVTEYVGSSYVDCVDIEALRMAISALETQPDLSSYSDKLWRNAYERGKAEAQAEIVRCKDCKWKQGAECVRFADVRPWPNDFCSRAERRIG
jgi:hypothetical protein